MNRSVPAVMIALVALGTLLGVLCLFVSPLRATFLFVSGLGVAMALGTVLARNLVHAALFLVAFFFLVACQFVLLEVDFLAAVQVLLYIGAVAILLMFGIMLTRNIQGEERRRGGWLVWLPAGAVALALFAMLARGILAPPVPRNAVSWHDQTRPPLVEPDGSLTPQGQVASNLGLVIGQEMLGRWVVPFELAGLLLTAALVGAVSLAMSARDEPDPPSQVRPVLRGSFERTLR